MKNAYAGDTILPAKIAKKITDAAAMISSDKEYKLKKAFNFSEREVEIALMLSDGFTNRQIAWRRRSRRRRRKIKKFAIDPRICLK